MTDYNHEIKKVVVNGKTLRVYACWSSGSDYEKGIKADFYDIYEDDGNVQTCLNEGDPYYKKPTLTDLKELLLLNQ